MIFKTWNEETMNGAKDVVDILLSFDALLSSTKSFKRLFGPDDVCNESEMTTFNSSQIGHQFDGSKDIIHKKMYKKVKQNVT